MTSIWESLGWILDFSHVFCRGAIEVYSNTSLEICDSYMERVCCMSLLNHKNRWIKPSFQAPWKGWCLKESRKRDKHHKPCGKNWIVGPFIHTNWCSIPFILVATAWIFQILVASNGWFQLVDHLLGLHKRYPPLHLPTDRFSDALLLFFFGGVVIWGYNLFFFAVCCQVYHMNGPFAFLSLTPLPFKPWQPVQAWLVGLWLRRWISGIANNSSRVTSAMCRGG